MTIELDTDNDWIADARRVLSPNCDARPDSTDVTLIIIHGISLPPGKYGGPYVDQLFCNCLDTGVDPYFSKIEHLRVSSHLLIDRQGEMTQYVPFSQRAWHAGESAFNGRQGCNDFSIGIELEGCDDEPYEARQYAVLADVVRAIRKTWPGIGDDHIVGHSDVAPGRKTDPGPAFDWDRLFELLS